MSSKRSEEVYVINDDNKEIVLEEAVKVVEIYWKDKRLTIWKEYCEYFHLLNEWEIKQGDKSNFSIELQ